MSRRYHWLPYELDTIVQAAGITIILIDKHHPDFPEYEKGWMAWYGLSRTIRARLDGFLSTREFIAGIAHEIGHAVLEHNERGLSQFEAELEADAFSAALTTPEAVYDYLARDHEYVGDLRSFFATYPTYEERKRNILDLCETIRIQS